MRASQATHQEGQCNLTLPLHPHHASETTKIMDDDDELLPTQSWPRAGHVANARQHFGAALCASSPSQDSGKVPAPLERRKSKRNSAREAAGPYPQLHRRSSSHAQQQQRSSGLTQMMSSAVLSWDEGAVAAADMEAAGPMADADAEMPHPAVEEVSAPRMSRRGSSRRGSAQLGDPTLTVIGANSATAVDLPPTSSRLSRRGSSRKGDRAAAAESSADVAVMADASAPAPTIPPRRTSSRACSAFEVGGDGGSASSSTMTAGGGEARPAPPAMPRRMSRASSSHTCASQLTSASDPPESVRSSEGACGGGGSRAPSCGAMPRRSSSRRATDASADEEAMQLVDSEEGAGTAGAAAREDEDDRTTAAPPVVEASRRVLARFPPPPADRRRAAARAEAARPPAPAMDLGALSGAFPLPPSRSTAPPSARARGVTLQLPEEASGGGSGNLTVIHAAVRLKQRRRGTLRSKVASLGGRRASLTGR